MPIAHDSFEIQNVQNKQGDAQVVSPISRSENGKTGLISKSHERQHKPYIWIPTQQAENDRRVETRAELIEKLKWGTSAWAQDFEDIPLTDLSNVLSSIPDASTQKLLPAAEIYPRTIQYPPIEPSSASPNQRDIDRPRPALHSGDFLVYSPRDYGQSQAPGASIATHNITNNKWLSTSPTSPWYIPSLQTATQPASLNTRTQTSNVETDSLRSAHTRGGSLSSSFVRLPPSSPLAQQSNNSDFELPDNDLSRRRSRSPEKVSRRHTITPLSCQNLRNLPFGHSHSVEARSLGDRSSRDVTSPYQAHQPRRYSAAFQRPLSYSLSQSNMLHQRRPSISSDMSPIQRAPLVGPYEESILRGRMSTLPSKPLNFVAQIGVLGKGNCKPNLRCPPHLSVPFPAVFYSYGEQAPKMSATNGGPSPYVGLIDLEHAAKLGSNFDAVDDSSIEPYTINEMDSGGDILNLSPLKKRRRKHEEIGSLAKKAPLGSYRIPQQGQLQIVIKNPNKTAVKLFLVPYDLTGMESGQKTFIRQRSYSAGPIIDMPLTSRSNFGTDRPEAALSSSDNPADRPVLRYLIHLPICSPSPGRFYLYKSIRVVFANRVPDGKENLRNETQLPEPRYSGYRPDSRLSHGSTDW